MRELLNGTPPQVLSSGYPGPRPSCSPRGCTPPNAPGTAADPAVASSPVARGLDKPGRPRSPPGVGYVEISLIRGPGMTGRSLETQGEYVNRKGGAV